MPRIDHQAIIRRLEAAPRAFVALAYPVTDREARRRPPSGAWSIHEILCHLVDEERLDFRARLASVLRGSAWPAWNPVEQDRITSYKARDFRGSLSTFAKERKQSVEWLRSLRAVNWNRAYKHPKWGPIRAGDLLAAWGAHDALHYRQIAKRLYEQAAADAPAYSTRYAGEWGI